MLKFLAVGLGGCTGAMLRYAMTFLPLSMKSGFPLTTLLVNFMGSLLLGVFSEFALQSENVNTYVILFLTVGLCGGFTTFSTFALESTNLIASGKQWISFIYILSSVALCLMGIMAGKSVITFLK